MREQKGITLIALVITIIVLMILSFSITINLAPHLNYKTKTNFNTDITQLKEEVEQYYIKNKSLPVLNQYTNISMLSSIKNPNDNDRYYVLDIRKLEVNLNYGSEYERVILRGLQADVTDITDLYIINEQSHSIYYPKGLEYDNDGDGINEIHYTIESQYTEINNIFQTAEGEQYNLSKRVNKPKLLSGMTPIKFSMPTSDVMGKKEITNEQDDEWYDYGTSYQTRRWANAQTLDGSMWVWIPRYAYKITYYTDSSKNTKSDVKTQYGSIDVVFLIGTTDNYYDENGILKTAQRQENINQAPIDPTSDFTVHPAFTDESNINYANGGWDSELTGIWVAKFEAGYANGNNNVATISSNVSYGNYNGQWTSAIENGTSSDASASQRNWIDGIYGSTTTRIKYPVFMPTTYSMNYINHNDAYLISKSLTDNGNIYGIMNTETDSHLMKNSEWGAVIYLAYSKYGQEGTEITINNANLNSGNRKRTVTTGKSGVDSVYAITGCTSNSVSASEKITTVEAINGVTANIPNEDGIYVWNQKSGQNASTTGTIYGVYDMSGGTLERTSSYVNNSNMVLSTYASSIVNETNIKYKQLYANNTTSGVANTASQNNFASNTNIYGDAIRETTTSNAGTSNSGWDTSSWNNDYSYFAALAEPLFLRGGSYKQTNPAGEFAYIKNDGASNYQVGFRTVLVNK